MVECHEEEDGSFTISWDENDPKESVLNTWTEQDFIDVIMNYVDQCIAEDNYVRDRRTKRGEELDSGS